MHLSSTLTPRHAPGASNAYWQGYIVCKNTPEEVFTMQTEWKSPEFEEIPLNCEVASYYSGELESSN